MNVTKRALLTGAVAAAAASVVPSAANSHEIEFITLSALRDEGFSSPRDVEDALDHYAAYCKDDSGATDVSWKWDEDRQGFEIRVTF